MSNETTRREFIVKAAGFAAGAVALSSFDSFGSDSSPVSKLPTRVLGKRDGEYSYG